MKTIIHEWIRQVEQWPDKICLQYSVNQYSYLQVNAISNKIANELNQQGIGKGSLVALHLVRSENIVFYILGVLKARAAYTFLDPNYPSERLSYMLDFTNPDLLVTETDNSLTLLSKKFILTPKFDLTELAEYKIPEIKEEDLAYLMYTSGSTGRPKAVMINHKNIAAYLPSIHSLKKVTSTDICLHTASFSFSSSVRQLFIPLLNGAKLIIASREETADLHLLLQIIKNEKITVIDTVQSLWRYGLQSIETLAQPNRYEILKNHLRLIVFSGDILPNIIVKRIQSLFKIQPPEIINLYGHTETIGGIAYVIPNNYSKDNGYVPIGKPLPHLGCLLLDDNLNKVPDGQPGEIYVYGDSITSGYFKNEELTQKVFVEYLKAETNEKIRLYKTGDIGKINTEQIIELLGRSDFQVKIRGARIELGEIETAMMSHPEIKDAVVASIQKTEGEQELTGYFILEDSSKIDSSDMRKYLTKKLPAVMIPKYFMALTEFPLTANGKLDRKSLPAPQNYVNNAKINVDGLTNTERALALIFDNLTGTRNFTLHDSFFDIGGHSLLAVQLTDHIEKILQKKVAAQQIYQTASIQSLAQYIDQVKDSNVYTPLVVLQPFGSKIPFVLVHGDDSNFLLPRILGEDVPFYSFFHQGQDGRKMEFRTIESIADKYIQEFIKTIPKGPVFLAGYSIGGVVAFEMACKLFHLGYKIEKLILFDSLAPQTKVDLLLGEHKYEIIKKEFKLISNNNIPQVYLEYSKYNLSQKIRHSLGYVKLLIKINYFHIRNKPIPLNMRNSYIMDTYRIARKNYFGNMYNGEILLFRSTINNFKKYDLGWSKFIDGKITIHEIRGDHYTIIKEPLIKEIGSLLLKELYDSN